MSSYALPRLISAARENTSSSIGYKSGASYSGDVENNKKVGRGLFVWPSGARYEGDFSDGLRTGSGVQQWPDGSCYSGDFQKDLRHGEGDHTWSNGEHYKGQFFFDHRHGKGTYTWPDGSSYTGTFYLDQKEGYGKFSFANGEMFEGLYHRDERSGPGVLTYPDGRQDVGLWSGEQICKLCSDLPGAFTMTDHQEFDYDPMEHELDIVVDRREYSTDRSVVTPVLCPPQQFDYNGPNTKVPEKTQRLYSAAIDHRSLGAERDIYEKAFFGNENKDTDKDTKETIKAWNNTPTWISMQKHVHRHRRTQSTVSFDVEKVLKGERTGFGAKGPLEELSERLILSAVDGDIDTVMKLLVTGKVFVDVADKNGQTALIGAAVNWHQDIINHLLNNGADVNRLNDEGTSALAACHVFFYPIESFKYNIAERYMEKPPEVEGTDLELKGILTNKNAEKAPAGVAAPGGRELSTDSGLPQSELRKGDLDVKVSIMEDGTSSVGGRSVSLKGSQKDNLQPQDSVSQSGASGVTDWLEEEEKLKIAKEKGQNSYNGEEEVRSGDSEKESKEQDLESLLEDAEKLQTSQEKEQPDSDFASDTTMRNYGIEVSDQLIEKCASQLSINEKIVSRKSSPRSEQSTDLARLLAIKKAEHVKMESTIRLLLKRGANPNASCVPMPVLFFAIKAADVEAVKLLLLKGASTSAKLSEQKGGLAPLHIACAIPGEEGVQISQLLLDALADPDVRATEDDSFLNKALEEEWIKDVISDESKELLGGRTPLHIACARDDSYKFACQVVHLLLDHHANPNLLCNGHSPLSLAIASGNDLAIDELLCYGANPSLSLTHGIGSALCVSTSTEFEHRRSPTGRIQLIDKLIRAGADILAPIPIGIKRISGTAVDFAYHMFNLDRRIAHMPYHALTHAERDTYNARRKLLGHVGDIMRVKAVEKEAQRLEEEEREGRRSVSPSSGFVYTGTGSKLPPGTKAKGGRAVPDDGHVKFNAADTAGRKGDRDQGHVSVATGVMALEESEARHLLSPAKRKAQQTKVSFSIFRKPLLKYCYECGRSVGVRLSVCTRCKEVYYCSKACKLKAWNARHKEECVRVGGPATSPTTKAGRIDSPTPATNPDRGAPVTVDQLTRDKDAQKIKVPVQGRSHSAKVRQQVHAGKDGESTGNWSLDELQRLKQKYGKVDNYSFE
ncbi:ankyrin repeat and MYND domain-containing protein 1-like [Lingula anatina]|uniref:Ankyrin repeat and MYND domain-containing protein 1-like n=1 Tax=Lingula anatina TaxID=7574 RepID=A0A1S3K7W5_LINAN|nr:ankyrin repeat and MYND domain-containing protein 1-like [Lingula anatina]|eukprot:XP_013418534.1 ankyrin repeat and MYND domain-containing protein 1-like [Lingula anatina]